jgi:hypothetical protein
LPETRRWTVTLPVVTGRTVPLTRTFSPTTTLVSESLMPTRYGALAAASALVTTSAGVSRSEAMIRSRTARERAKVRRIM